MELRYWKNVLGASMSQQVATGLVLETFAVLAPLIVSCRTQHMLWSLVVKGALPWHRLTNRILEIQSRPSCESTVSIFPGAVVAIHRMDGNGKEMLRGVTWQDRASTSSLYPSTDKSSSVNKSVT